MNIESREVVTHGEEKEGCVCYQDSVEKELESIYRQLHPPLCFLGLENPILTKDTAVTSGNFTPLKL